MDNATLVKIKKLIALANGSGFPEESASALGKAQALMLKHKISQAMLETVAEDQEDVEAFSDDPLNTEDVGKQKKAYWKSALTSVLCQFNGCYTFSRGKDIILVGKPSDITTVRYMYKYCVNEVDRLTKANCKGMGRTYSNNFRLGCVSSIRDSMQKEQDRVRNDAISAKKSLVVIDKTIVKIKQDRKDAERFANASFRLGSRSSKVRANSEGQEAGRSAGSSIYNSNAGRLGAPQKRIG